LLWYHRRGRDASGQLGDGTTTNHSSPPAADVLGGALAIVARGNHTCALMTSGGVRCWGDIGDGSTTRRSSPPAADALCGVEAIALGYQHTCALLTTGSVRCWGYGSLGQLGLPAPDYRRPSLVAGSS
jgi:alpha-tubulin suppressor-like RCC1 family protein